MKIGLKTRLKYALKKRTFHNHLIDLDNNYSKTLLVTKNSANKILKKNIY